MSDFDFTIPYEQLPEGFAESLDRDPADPVPTRPAATIVLLRDGHEGLETLMLRRTRRSGFVPGAYVFAGGRVDLADAEPRVLERLGGLTPAQAAHRLGLPEDASPPAVAYYAAALREAFEETGLLVGTVGGGGPAPSAGEDPAVAEIRDLLLADEIGFAEALDRLDVSVDAASVQYVAHWITPVQEPRRYDTRFFAAHVEPGREVLLNPREMTHSIWVTPHQALAMHRAGELPMVFPTIRTLESLLDWSTSQEALSGFAAREIPALLPRLVKTPTGVGLELP
jgi:8-oxo-dGTP pyrophosphatase MutT (NUDIX family)